MPPGTIGLPATPGSGRLDQVNLPGAAEPIADLAGNVSEWMLDKWSRQEEAFWGHGGVFHDPIANLDSPADGSDLGTYSTRGGYFESFALELRAAFRGFVNANEISAGSGFRCARPDR